MSEWPARCDAPTRKGATEHRHLSYWAALDDAFTGLAVHGIQTEGPREMRCFNCTLKDLVARGLLTRQDSIHLVTTQTRVTRRAARFQDFDYQRALLAREPRSLVAASYALARDLSQLSRRPEFWEGID